MGNPKMDKEQGFHMYNKYDEAKGPLPETFDFVNQLKITEEQVNQSYEHQLPFYMKTDGSAAPKYSSNWEKAVAYHHGLYIPETLAPQKQPMIFAWLFPASPRRFTKMRQKTLASTFRLRSSGACRCSSSNPSRR